VGAVDPALSSGFAHSRYPEFVIALTSSRLFIQPRLEAGVPALARSFT